MKWERQQKVLLLGFLIWEPEGRQAFCLKKKSCFIEFLIWDRDSRQPLSEKVSFQRKEKTYFQEYSLGKKREICVDIYFSV